MNSSFNQRIMFWSLFKLTSALLCSPVTFRPKGDADICWIFYFCASEN